MAAIRAPSMGEVNGVNGDKGTWATPDSSNQEVSETRSIYMPFVRTGLCRSYKSYRLCWTAQPRSNFEDVVQEDIHLLLTIRAFTGCIGTFASQAY
jgi:hypothetical protein